MPCHATPCHAAPRSAMAQCLPALYQIRVEPNPTFGGGNHIGIWTDATAPDPTRRCAWGGTAAAAAAAATDRAPSGPQQPHHVASAGNEFEWWGLCGSTACRVEDTITREFIVPNDSSSQLVLSKRSADMLTLWKFVHKFSRVSGCFQCNVCFYNNECV